MKFIFKIYLVLLVLGLNLACSNNHKNSIVGVWENTKKFQDFQGELIIFRSDSTFILRQSEDIINSDVLKYITGKYACIGDSLFLSLEYSYQSLNGFVFQETELEKVCGLFSINQYDNENKLTKIENNIKQSFKYDIDNMNILHFGEHSFQK